MSPRFNSFAEFWPYYVNEHSRPGTRLLHLIGTTTGVALLVYFIASGRWWLFPLALVPGYGAAWAGHFFIEKNKPANVSVSGLVVHGRLQDDWPDADGKNGC